MCTQRRDDGGELHLDRRRRKMPHEQKGALTDTLCCAVDAVTFSPERGTYPPSRPSPALDPQTRPCPSLSFEASSRSVPVPPIRRRAACILLAHSLVAACCRQRAPVEGVRSPSMHAHTPMHAPMHAPPPPHHSRHSTHPPIHPTGQLPAQTNRLYQRSHAYNHTCTHAPTHSDARNLVTEPCMHSHTAHPPTHLLLPPSLSLLLYYHHTAVAAAAAAAAALHPQRPPPRSRRRSPSPPPPPSSTTHPPQPRAPQRSAALPPPHTPFHHHHAPHARRSSAPPPPSPPSVPPLLHARHTPTLPTQDERGRLPASQHPPTTPAVCCPRNTLTTCFQLRDHDGMRGDASGWVMQEGGAPQAAPRENERGGKQERKWDTASGLCRQDE